MNALKTPATVAAILGVSALGNLYACYHFFTLNAAVATFHGAVALIALLGAVYVLVKR